MDTNINRRTVLGIGGVAAAGGLIGAGSLIGADAAAGSSAAGPTDARSKIARTYARAVAEAQGTWSSYISVTEPDGSAPPAVEERADEVVEAYSVNKIAVATAVLDKIDRGLLSLDQQVDVTADIVIKDTDGIFGLDGAYPSKVTLGHAMAALLTVSDNTAVRLCGLVCPAKELNEILQAKGFVHTQVKPVPNPNRFFLGTTTARETHTLLRKLVAGELLSASSTEYLLAAIRSLTAFTDGIRLRLTSDERLRVATKAGWFEDGRNEAGVVFDTAGAPLATYSLFASGQFAGSPGVDADFSANHPALRARTKLGRTIVDAVAGLSTPAATAARRHETPEYRPYNGG